MNKVEIKAKVDARLKMLVAARVRLRYRNSELYIMEYDYFDNTGGYVIHVSDREESIEVPIKEIGAFIDELKRKDGQRIAPWNDQPTAGRLPALPQKDSVRTSPTTARADIHTTVAPPPKPEPVRATGNGKIVHVDSTVKVYVTRDYGRFAVLKGNRPLNKHKIRKIMEEINAGTNLLYAYPITVIERGEKLEVFDGQHRLEVAKQLGSNVWYIMLQNEVSMYDVAATNSNTEKWNSADFINCYATAGNTHYEKLREFGKKYGFPVSVSLALLATGKISSDSGGDAKESEKFQKGKFQVKKYDEACAIADQVMRFSFFPAYKSRTFAITVCKIIEAGKTPLDEVVSACEKHSDLLEAQANWKMYLQHLEGIVNKGKSLRRIIY